MNWNINDASLQGQFQTDNIGEFTRVLMGLIQIRERYQSARSKILLPKSMGICMIDADTDFNTFMSQQVRHSNPNLWRYIKRWIQASEFNSEVGNVIKDENNAYIKFGNTKVNGTAIENAVRKNTTDTGKLFSFQGGKLKFENTQLLIRSNMAGSFKKVIELENFTSLEKFETDVCNGAALESRKTWNDMISYAKESFGNLEFHVDAFAPIKKQPISNINFERLYEIFEILNNYMKCLNNEQDEKAKEILNQYFHNGVYFSCENKKNNNKKLLTFERSNGIKYFAPWFGKIRINKKNYRIHFEWPIEKGKKSLEVFYVGPKFKQINDSKADTISKTSFIEVPKRIQKLVHEKRNWDDFLGLSNRTDPELFESEDQVKNTPFASDIKRIMREFKVKGVICVQGKPEIVIYKQITNNNLKTQELAFSLWNQALASVLVVVGVETINIYSLLKTPSSKDSRTYFESALLKSISIESDETIDDFVYGVKSGRLYLENPEFFKPEMRVNQVLLENLNSAYKSLTNQKLNSDNAKALLIQNIFIAVLEDRGILSDVFISKLTNGHCKTFAELLISSNFEFLEDLFDSLKSMFKGDLFASPCSLTDSNTTCKLTPEIIGILHRFRQSFVEEDALHQNSGRINFKYTPITLICDTCYRFLYAGSKSKGENDMFFSSLSIVDHTLTSIWNNMDKGMTLGGQFLDPTCASGLFLVRCHQKILEQICTDLGLNSISWKKLGEIVERIHGFGEDEKSLKIVVFSLYLQFLEFASTPMIEKFQNKRVELPKIWNESIILGNYFRVSCVQSKFDVIFGNPPLKAHKNTSIAAMKWCIENHKNPPNKDISWALAFKSQMDANENGIVALVMPADGFLYSKNKLSVSARNSMIDGNQFLRIINLSDFQNSMSNYNKSPEAIIIFKNQGMRDNNHKIEYFVPKINMKYIYNKTILICNKDIKFIRNREIIKNNLIFYKKFLSGRQEAKIYDYLNSFPKLGQFMDSRIESVSSYKWKINRGVVHKKHVDGASHSLRVGNDDLTMDFIPDSLILPVNASISEIKNITASDEYPVEKSNGYKILVKRNISLEKTRLIASIIRNDILLSDNVYEIFYPNNQIDNAKFIIAILNSSLAYWWAFFNCPSNGNSIPQLNLSELLSIPCPDTEDFVTDKLKYDSIKIKEKIIKKYDKINNIILKNKINIDKKIDIELKNIDKLVYRYFNLSENEIAVIEDSIRHKLPALNKSSGNLEISNSHKVAESIPYSVRSGVSKLWSFPKVQQRKLYARKLDENLSPWLIEGKSISIDLYCKNKDFGIVKIQICNDIPNKKYKESKGFNISDELSKLYLKIKDEKIVQLIPDYRIFDDDNVYLIKPMLFQHWMESAAIEDSTNIAMDIQKFVYKNNAQEI